MLETFFKHYLILYIKRFYSTKTLITIKFFYDIVGIRRFENVMQVKYRKSANGRCPESDNPHRLKKKRFSFCNYNLTAYEIKSFVFKWKCGPFV